VTIKATQNKLLRIRRRIAELYRQEREVVGQLVGEGKCDHSATSDYKWEHDNGYGRQSPQIGKKCTFCGFIDLWNRGGFFDPKDLTA
jgi:hypothetical protein